jgi:hypothetical protein
LNTSRPGTARRVIAEHDLTDLQRQLGVVDRAINRMCGRETARQSAAEFAYGRPAAVESRVDMEAIVAAARRTVAASRRAVGSQPTKKQILKGLKRRTKKRHKQLDKEWRVGPRSLLIWGTNVE